MNYDLIVIGAGPAGLMAARTAGRDGMKVLLLERKRNITEIRRACVQIFYLNKLDPNWLTMKPTPKMDAYTEQVSADAVSNGSRFNYLDAGFSLDYKGPLRAYHNWVNLSPSGNPVSRYPVSPNPWGYFYSKEAFLGGLLADVVAAGVSIVTETTALSVKTVTGGVEVRVSGKTGEQTLAGRAAVVADGLDSRIVDGLGLNKDRPQRSSRPRQILIYIVEGINCPYDNSWVMWSIPSLKADNVYMGLGPNGCNLLGAGSSSPAVPPANVLEGIMKWPAFAPWFTKARVVGKMATALVSRPSLKQLVVGNAVIAGDAGASVEGWIQGAVVGGYKAVKAIRKQWEGGEGYREYTDWWAKAFAFNQPNYSKIATDPMRGAAVSLGAVFSRFDDRDVDDLYKMFEGQVGIPSLLAMRDAGIIKEKRPDLYTKMEIPLRSS